MQASVLPPPPASAPPAPSSLPASEAAVARKVLKETLRVKKGENVVIETWNHTLDLARAFVLEARKLGAHPVLLFEDERTYWDSVDSADPRELGKVGSHEWALLSKAQAYVFLWGPEDRPRFRRLDPKVMEKLHAYNDEWYARAKRARLRGARMEIGRVTEANAQQFNVPLAAWRQEVLEATMADTATMVREGKHLAQVLQRGKRVTIDHPNGTHLELQLRGKRPVVEDGVVGAEDVAAGQNMTSVPGGYVAVALDERYGEGTFRSNRTSFLSGGRAEGGEWTISGGRLTASTYRSGGEFLSAPFEKAPKKGRDQLGMLSIGLNPRISSSPQMEDQERGVVLVTLGRNDNVGGSNKVPFLTWLALGGANVSVDGKPLVAGGNIV
ncbi:MAG: aminopeptidase [Euryarchaeota archaeon]|nr:aminopeptidase [Euryarchaeota archaeon]MDE1836772.1 aminopeptidase [Euryarchaeota archaeon]MDE1879790.1 aminopeptidase [Euryarchaeota archaeon]